MRTLPQHHAAFLVLLTAISACHIFVGLDEVDPVRDSSTVGQGGLSAGGALSQGGAGGAATAGGGGEASSLCGNGTLEPGEDCDDGNLIDGDGCSAECAFDAAAQCPPTSEILLQSGMGITLSGTTFAASDELSSNCGMQRAPEVTYRVLPSEQGTLRATLAAPFSKALYIRQTCTGIDVACNEVDEFTELILEFPVLAEEPHFLLVEGNAGDEAAIFQLFLELNTCGDGDRSSYEECDDGNTIAGDGCSDSCVVECDNGIKRPESFHCYRLFTNNRNWDDALSDCVGLGPGWSLAGISSAEERNFIDNVVDPSGHVWLGGNDIINEGTFVWVNGEPFSYDGWNDGKPNNAGAGGEDCVELISLGGSSNDVFNDEGCGDAQDYICELTPAGT